MLAFAIGNIVHKFPKARAVIHFHSVAQFVQHHIVGKMLGNQLYINTKTYVPATAAATPTAVTVAQRHTVVTKIETTGKIIQSTGQIF